MERHREKEQIKNEKEEKRDKELNERISKFIQNKPNRYIFTKKHFESNWAKIVSGKKESPLIIKIICRLNNTMDLIEYASIVSEEYKDVCVVYIIEGNGRTYNKLCIFRPTDNSIHDKRIHRDTITIWPNEATDKDIKDYYQKNSYEMSQIYEAC